MAKFTMELPSDEIKQIEWLYGNVTGISGKMTEAGARVVLDNLRANVPSSWRGSNIMNNIGLSKTYRTPSDGGVNTQVMIKGYFINKNGRKTPAPVVANVFEYGRSAQSRGGKFEKRPFFRKAFKKKLIEQAMLAEQKKASGGILDE